MSCYFTKIFVHLSVIGAIYCFSVYKLIGWDPANIYYVLICSKLTINAVESRSAAFIVNIKNYFTFFSVSIVKFEQVNVYRGGLSCVILLPKV